MRSYPHDIVPVPNYIKAIHTIIREDSTFLQKYYNTKIDFIGLNLCFASLSHANFKDANLVKAKFVGSDLGYAEFNNADVFQTSFYSTNLSRAKFEGMINFVDFERSLLPEAHFEACTFSFVRLNSATWIDGTQIKTSHFEGEAGIPMLEFMDGTQSDLSSSVEIYNKSGDT